MAAKRIRERIHSIRTYRLSLSPKFYEYDKNLEHNQAVEQFRTSL